MTEERNETGGEVVAEAEQGPEAHQAKETFDATAEAVGSAKQAAEEATAPGGDVDPLVAEIKETVKDVAAQVDRLPVTQKVKEVARELAEGVERTPVGAKLIERVKTTAEEVEKSQFAANVRKAVKDTSEGIEKSPLVAAAHKVLLAGIGAVALAQEEIEDFVNRLVERGQIAEADGKRMLKDVLEKRKDVLERTSEFAEAPKRAAEEAEKHIEAVLDRLNVPTKDEIEALSAKITALTKKVDELKKQP